MKKSIWCLAISFCFAFITAMSTIPQSAEALTLRWAHPSPKRGPEVEQMEWVTSELAKRTEGRVKATVYWSGSLVKIKEGAEAVKNGLADIAWVSSSYHTGFGELGKIPYTAGFLAAHPNPVILTKAWMKTNEISSGFRDELKAKNIVPFAYKWYDIYWAFTNKPIRSTKDYPGVKIRAIGDQQQIGYRSVGAVPLFLPFPEVYSGLSKNIIHGVSASLDTAYRYKIQEVVKYGIQHDIMGSWAYWCINLKTYNKLSEKDQKTLLQLGKELSIRIAQRTYDERSNQIAAFEKAGVQFIKFSKEDLQEWASKPEIKAYQKELIEELEGKGLPALQMKKIYLGLLEMANQ